MRRPRRYRWWRRTARDSRSALIPAMLLAAGVVFLAILFRILRPGLAEYAENWVQYRTTIAMEQAVSDAISKNGDAVSALATVSDGSAAALTTNSAAAEQIRAAVVERTYQQLNELEEEQLRVPLGTLVDPQYLTGIGPEIPAGVVGLGNVSAAIRSEFTDSGVNQTKYSMTLQIRAQINLHALWCSRTILVENDYPLTETVIVGEVPAVYWQP